MDTTGTQPAPEPEPVYTGAEASTFSFSGYIEDSKLLTGCGFGRRAGARIIDMAIHYIIAWCSGAMLGLFLGIISIMTHQSVYTMLSRLTRGPGWPTFVGGLIGYVSFCTIAEGLHGSTPGKFMLGMVVVQEEGAPCQLKSALVRSLAYYLDGLFFGIVGYMAMSKSGSRQRYGDQWAHTVVAERKSITQENLRGGGAFAVVLLLAAMADSVFLVTGIVAKMLL